MDQISFTDGIVDQIKMAMERPQVLLALETLNELYAA